MCRTGRLTHIRKDNWNMNKRDETFKYTTRTAIHLIDKENEKGLSGIFPYKSQKNVENGRPYSMILSKVIN